MELHEILDITFKLILAIAPIIWGLIKVKLHLKDQKWIKVASIVEQAVQTVYDEFVRSIKEGGNKLTQDQVKKARDLAWNKAIEVGKDRGMDIAKELISIGGKEYFPILIDKAIGALVKKK